MRENADIPKKNYKLPIILLFVLFLAVVCLRPAQTDYGIVYVLIALGLLTGAAYLIMYGYLASFSYLITENELVLIKSVGSHEKYLIVAPLDSILYVKKNDGSIEKVNCCVGDALLGEFTSGSRKISFTFSPSDKFITKLKNSLGERFL